MNRTVQQKPDGNPAENDGGARDSAPAGAGQREQGEPPVPAVELDAKALVEERDRLAAENAELRDQLLRRRADFENSRKRSERERLQLTEYAAMNVVRALLPVLDDMERAMDASRDVADEFHAGMHLIARQFRETLERFGLKPIQAVGQPFDPNLHQAVDRVVTEEYPDQTVVEEWQRGYMFKDRLLRPAMVKVAVHP